MKSKNRLKKIASWLLAVTIIANSTPLSVWADTLPTGNSSNESTQDEQTDTTNITEDGSANLESDQIDDTVPEDKSVTNSEIKTVETDLTTANAQVEEKPVLYTAVVDDELEIVELPELQTTANSISFFGNNWLKDGHYEKWIDRLANLPSYATDFYEWLEENSDNDGTNDALINVTHGSSVGGGYAYQAVSLSGNLYVTFSSSDPTQDEINTVYSNAFDETVGSQIAEAQYYLTSVYSAFDRDHPEVFWLSGSSQTLTSSGSGSFYINKDGTATIPYSAAVYFSLDYGSFDIRAAEYQNVSTIKNDIATRDTIVEEITSAANGTVKQKIQYLNNWLTTHNCYNSSSNLNNINHDARECIGALKGKTGTVGPVCESYARAFKVLCDELNIPCVLVDGYASSKASGSGEAHMWNYVKMDDGNWYAVDVTWNDPTVQGVTSAVSGHENENWLLLGSDTVVSNNWTFIESHPVSNTATVNGIAFTNGPELSEDAYVEGPASTYEWIYTDNGDGTITITGVEGELVGDIVIPSEIDGKKVSAIGDKAFYKCDAITSVTITQGVTSIGNSAFYICDNLCSAVIPGSVTNIGKLAFYGTDIVSVDLPEGLINIGNSAFYKCYSMTNVTIPSTVTSIGDGAFDFATALEKFTVASNNQNYKSVDGVLYNKEMTLLLKCPSTKSGNFEIPNTVTNVCDNAFEYSKLSSVTIPTSVTEIGEYAFYDADLTSVIIPGNVKVIGKSAFETCTLLSSVIIEKGVQKIGESAFLQCRSISNIVIPTGVSSIGDMTFYSCSKLNSITIPKSVTSIGNNTFYGCSSLSDVYYGGTAKDWNNITIGNFNEALNTATIHFTEVEESLDLTVNVVSSATVTEPDGGWKEGSNTFTVSSDLACYVAVSYDGGATYTRLPATASGNAYSFTADNVDADTIITVGILGDVNGNGRIDALDARQIVVAVTNTPDTLKLIALDVNGNGRPDALDARKIVVAITGSPFTW